MAEQTNFLGYDSVGLEKALFSIIPAPCEDGVTYVSGQAAAPRAIIDASSQIESYDEETGLDVIARDGVHCIAPESAPAGQELHGWLTRNINEALDATAVPIILGGDGTISYNCIRALAERATKEHQELSVLHIDAHADLNNIEDDDDNNLNTMRKLIGSDTKVNLCQIGIRSLSQDAFDIIADEEKGIDCYFMSDLRYSSDDDWQDDIITALSSPVYISIDLSAFDSAIIPNVGNPEPGGLNWQQVTRLLKKVASHRRIAAIDIVELCPREDDVVSDYTAARLLYKTMSYILSGGKMLEKNQVINTEE